MWTRRQILAGSLALGRAGTAQTFQSGTALVLAPATVKRRGRPVRGLGEGDFALFDDGAERPVRVEEEPQAVATVLALHASFEARKSLHRMRSAVSLFGPLVAGENGRLGVLAFRDEVEVASALSADSGASESAVRSLEARGSGCCFVDAVRASAEMLGDVDPAFRRVAVVVSEDRDQSSRADLQETLKLLQTLNVTVYAMTYSPGLMQLGREVPTGP